MNPEHPKPPPDAKTPDIRLERITLKGPKKELFVSIQTNDGVTYMDDNIENTPTRNVQKEGTSKETTTLYLLALRAALKIALKTQTNLKWNFTAIDPAHKMDKWFQVAKTEYSLKTEIPKEEVQAELEKLDRILETFSQRKNIEILTNGNYLTLAQAHRLEEGRTLTFDESREGKNLAGIYGGLITFLAYKEAHRDPKAWPLIVIETSEGKKTISSQFLILKK